VSETEPVSLAFRSSWRTCC